MSAGVGESPDGTQIARLLREGLDSYGEDDVSGAISSWQAVLELDPGNAEACDYLESVGALSDENEPDDANRSMVRGLLENAQEQIAAADFEAAYDLLAGAADGESPVLEVEAMLDLVRSQLMHRYRMEVGDLAAIPVVNTDGTSLTQYNLPTEAGFMLSLVDGATPVQDMISLSGMDAFDALRLLRGLLDAGIVEVSA